MFGVKSGCKLPFPTCECSLKLLLFFFETIVIWSTLPFVKLIYKSRLVI